jgi:hypothetical protein
MRRALVILFLTSLISACGVETAATAGAAAEIKRREMEAAKKNLETATQKIEQNTQQILRNAADAEKSTKD